MGRYFSFLSEILELNREYVCKRYRRRKAMRHKEDKFFVDLPRRILQEAPCVFVLSTGRCGTLLLTKILRKVEGVDVYHTPQPELVYPSRLVYSEGRERLDSYDAAILCARYDLVESSFITDRIYVETNCRITFFAPHIHRVFRSAKFIHLVRHPLHFVQSALARGYYQSARADRGHIIPYLQPIVSQWEEMSLIEKASWNWNETNRFIEVLKETVPQERMLTVKSEDLFENPRVAQQIIAYCGAQPVDFRRIESLLKRPVNAATPRKKQQYRWGDRERGDIKRIVAELAEFYGYRI